MRREARASKVQRIRDHAAEPFELLGPGAAPWPRLWPWVVCFVLHLIPIWIVPHYPSQDGASLVYQAVVLRHHAHVAILQQHFTLNFEPFPNWLGFAVLQPLLACFVPAVAEKVLLSLYALVLPAAVLWVGSGLGKGSRHAAFLSFPCIFNFSLQTGLYNFCLGVPLALFALGYWWRHREATRSHAVLLLALLLVAAFFSHVLACCFALAALVGIAALCVRTMRGWVGLGIAAAPAVALVIRYLGSLPAPTVHAEPFLDRIRDLLLLGGLPIGDAQVPIWLATCAPLASLIVLTFARHRPRNPGPAAFALVALTLLVASVLVPNDTTNGSLLAPRFRLFAFLLLLPALMPALGGRARVAFDLAIGAAVVANLLFVCRHNLRASEEYEEYLSGIPHVEAKSVLVPIFTSIEVPDARILLSPLPHAGNVYGSELLAANLQSWHASSNVVPSNFPVVARKSRERVLADLPPGQLYFLIWSKAPLENPPPPGTVEVFRSATGRLRILRRD